MKKYAIENLRNIALAGHNGCGKTSLAEALFHSAGITNRLGKTEDGNTVMDFDPDEIKRQMSINLSVGSIDWENYCFNILDVPGYMDFQGELVSAAMVADTVLMVLNAANGIEVGTEQSWEVVQNREKPVAFFINKLNMERTDFFAVVDQIQERLGVMPAVLQIPVGEAGDFKGVVDLISKKAFINGEEASIPADLQDKVEEYWEKLQESAAEADEELMNKYFEEGELSQEDVVKGIRMGLASASLYPVFCGSASINMGIDGLLHAFADYFPAPTEVPAPAAKKGDEEVELIADPAGPLVAYVFKSFSEAQVGETFLVRVFSGTMKSGEEYVTSQGSKEKVGTTYSIVGKNRKDADALHAGEIGALVKLKDVTATDTIYEKSYPAAVVPPEYPNPVTAVAVHPAKQGDEDKLSSGLSRITMEDKTLRYVVDAEMHQTLLYGIGDTQIDIAVQRLKRKFNVDVELDEPRIPYRETIRGKAEVRYRHKKQSGGRGQFGEVYLRLQPLPRGEDFQFLDEIVGGVIPSKFVPAVEKGVRESMAEGPVAGYKVVDISAAVFDGQYHPVDSSEMAFKIAASQAFKNAFKEAKPVLLEPYVKVEIKVPDEFMGDIMGDMSSRRGKILGTENKGGATIITAEAPQAELHKYSSSLRSMTQGKGIYSQEFAYYEPVPQEVAEKVIEEAKRRKEEE